MKLPALRDADVQTRLATYLNDHLGGATGGVELVRRLRDSNQGSEYGPPLEVVARQIEEDVASLREIMARFGVDEDRIKQTVAFAAEKVGRLKLNGQLLGYSPLSRLVELEGMMLGRDRQARAVDRAERELRPGLAAGRHRPRAADRPREGTARDAGAPPPPRRRRSAYLSRFPWKIAPTIESRAEGPLLRR